MDKMGKQPDITDINIIHGFLLCEETNTLDYEHFFFLNRGYELIAVDIESRIPIGAKVGSGSGS